MCLIRNYLPGFKVLKRGVVLLINGETTHYLTVLIWSAIIVTAKPLNICCFGFFKQRFLFYSFFYRILPKYSSLFVHPVGTFLSVVLV